MLFIRSALIGITIYTALYPLITDAKTSPLSRPLLMGNQIPQARPLSITIDGQTFKITCEGDTPGSKNPGLISKALLNTIEDQAKKIDIALDREKGLVLIEARRRSSTLRERYAEIDWQMRLIQKELERIRENDEEDDGYFVLNEELRQLQNKRYEIDTEVLNSPIWNSKKLDKAYEARWSFWTDYENAKAFCAMKYPPKKPIPATDAPIPKVSSNNGKYALPCFLK